MLGNIVAKKIRLQRHKSRFEQLETFKRESRAALQ